MGYNWDRMFIGILSLGYLIISVVLVLVALGWTTPVAYVESYLYRTNPWVLGLTGGFVFIASLTLFLSSFKKKPVMQTPIHETNLGQIRITITALEHLVLKAAKSVHGIRDIRPIIQNTAAGLSIQLKVQVLPDVSIPNITADLQKIIRDYLQKTAGTTVQEIRILVNKVSWENKARVE